MKKIILINIIVIVITHIFSLELSYDELNTYSNEWENAGFNDENNQIPSPDQIIEITNYDDLKDTLNNIRNSEIEPNASESNIIQ